jgi:hypothetical protein
LDIRPNVDGKAVDRARAVIANRGATECNPAMPHSLLPFLLAISPPITLEPIAGNVSVEHREKIVSAIGKSSSLPPDCELPENLRGHSLAVVPEVFVDDRSAMLVVRVVDNSDKSTLAFATVTTPKEHLLHEEAGSVMNGLWQRVATCEDSPGHPLRAAVERTIEEANREVLLGNFSNAVAAGEKALKLDPQAIDAHKVLGVAYMRLKKYCAAKPHYEAFIKGRPSSVTTERIQAILAAPEMQSCK